MPGEEGRPGEPGLDGLAGPPGSQGQPGDMATQALTIVSHSGSIPSCPAQSTLLWEGYNLVQIYFQRIGAGSCPKNFSTNSLYVWSANNLNVDKESYGAEDVSRCVVCEVPGPVLTIHSLGTDTMQCPDSYKTLWQGYSYFVGVSLVLLLIQVIVKF